MKRFCFYLNALRASCAARERLRSFLTRRNLFQEPATLEVVGSAGRRMVLKTFETASP